MPASLDAALPYLRAEREPEPGDTPDGRAPVLVRITADLLVGYRIDADDDFSFVVERDLQSNGVDVGALHERAVGNLARLAKAGNLRIAPYGPIVAVQFDGDLEATLLLVDELCEQLQAEVGDDMLAAVPARDVWAVGNVGDAEAAAALEAIVAKVWRENRHRLSRELLIREDGGWSTFDPRAPG